MTTVTLVSDHPPGWAPGTHHYRCSDGLNLAVEAPTVPEGQTIPRGAEPMVDELLVQLGTNRAALTYVARPTVIFACNPDGSAIDLTPLHSFPAGTTHEDALTQAGYEV